MKPVRDNSPKPYVWLAKVLWHTWRFIDRASEAFHRFMPTDERYRQPSIIESSFVDAYEAEIRELFRPDKPAKAKSVDFKRFGS